VSGRPIEIVGVVGSALQAVSPDATIAFRPLSDDVAASMAQERLLATLAGLFAALALILAGVGLYGLMSHLAARRRTEIGIRLALGSEPAGIVRLILRRAATVIAAGVIAGTAVSVWTAGIAGSLLYGVEPRDPAILSASAAVLVVVGLGAAWFPARQASKADPAETLRVG
jgi:ABC-type antimicrobial peptide transport system permease subunit